MRYDDATHEVYYRGQWFDIDDLAAVEKEWDEWEEDEGEYRLGQKTLDRNGS